MICLNCNKPEVNVFCDMKCRREYEQKQAPQQKPQPSKIPRPKQPRLCPCGTTFTPRRCDQIYCCRLHAVNIRGKLNRDLARSRKHCQYCGGALGKWHWKYCSLTCKRKGYMQEILADPMKHELYKRWHRDQYYRRVGLADRLGW